MKKRNQYTPEFKTKVVLEVLREEGTINEIATRYEISPLEDAIDPTWVKTWESNVSKLVADAWKNSRG